MELYLDSADIKEIRTAVGLGFLTGLTTTPTFMHREGVQDVDQMILQLAELVPVLQIEALGETAEAIVADAHRQLALGLDPQKTVFKIPMSLEGVIACKKLRAEGLMVNMHLIYTIQQAYMAMQAGASYICVLAGRMQDQGYDAMKLIGDCVEMVNFYGSDSKVMFSSVRHSEHVRNAIELGCHTITVPWKIMKALTENSFTELGTKQFIDHTRQITQRVSDIMKSVNPTVKLSDSVSNALLRMTEFGFGAVSVVDENGNLAGIFTDGDLRRKLMENRDILHKNMSDFSYNRPQTIEANALLQEALQMFKATNVDTLIVTQNDVPIGMLDIQDVKL
jgi:transaldolase